MPEDKPTDHSQCQVAPEKAKAFDPNRLHDHVQIRAVYFQVDGLLHNTLEVVRGEPDGRDCPKYLLFEPIVDDHNAD